MALLKSTSQKTRLAPESLPFDQSHYKSLRWRHTVRLLLTYLAPLILLTIYFLIQHNAIVSEGHRIHLRAIAESQANTLDLFLSERRLNLSNLIDGPRFSIPPDAEDLERYLGELRKASETFVDIGYFDSSGIQTAYAGPYPSLERRNYRSEHWYVSLREAEDEFIITDIYLGFRQKPHFTIAVSRIIDRQFVVLRATLDPKKMYEYISSLEGAREVYTSIVSKAGYYQLVTEHIGTPLEASTLVPSDTPRLGSERLNIDGSTIQYSYSWLRTADWALIVQWASEQTGGFLSGAPLRIVATSLAIMLLILVIILIRAQKLVQLQMESDRTRAQLEHAAKLASVGELAAGIAHEINNPLAVITEEAGLIKDFLDPEFEETIDQAGMVTHLDAIQESAFRCRDITGKLLGFVRKSEMHLQRHDVHEILDEVVDGLLGPELGVSNIEIIRDYDRNIPQLITDKNQLQQVLLNIINNGRDAIGRGPGKITITTSRESDDVCLALSDTGKGMTADQLQKIFMPFYTTKEVGKGTGLGLSVSYGIINSLGGRIEVDSVPGKGSTFKIILPAH